MTPRRDNFLSLVVGLLCAIILASVAAPASGAIFIDIGVIELQADTADQTVAIWVTSDTGDEVAGVNFNIELAGGGSVLGGLAGPDITDVDLLTGTLFEGNHQGQTDLGSLAQLAMHTVVTDVGTVPADGLLATVTFDTTGFTVVGSEWTLALADTHNGATDFAPTPAVITDGTLRLVPEPAAFALLGLGGAMILLRRRRPRP